MVATTAVPILQRRMSSAMSLSGPSRLLTRATAIAFALFGLVLFILPAWSAQEFPWKVSEFVAMTIGGWCIGTATIAWLAARQWRWSTVYPLLAYVWSFAIVEVAVLVWFRELIRFGGLLTWPYLLALGLGLVTAVVGVWDLARLRPTMASDSEPAPGWFRPAAAVFALLVGALAVKGLLDPDSGRRLTVFPEALSPFTVRAFAVFYGAIALGAVPLAFAKPRSPFLAYGRAGMGLIVPITVAALVYLGRFDFAGHPVQVVYIAAYVVVFVALLGVEARERGRRRSTVLATT